MKVKLVTVLFIVWLAGAAFAADAADRWKVENIRLAPRTELVQGITFNTAGLTLNATDMQRGTVFTLSADVVLSEVRDTALYGNKLAVMGIAGNTEAVVIFDLALRKEIDWFYCGGAKQVLPGKIVLAMSVPNHPLVLNDVVVMFYDMEKTPSANRRKIEPDTHFPLPVEAQGEEVLNAGIPIYPQKNANDGSYAPTSRESEDDIIGADLNTIVAVSPERLVFVAARGFEETWLEILDLPHGTTKAKSRRIEIPRGQLHPDPEWLKNHPYISPNRVEISKIQIISPTQIRLQIPSEEYGVDSVDLQIPDRQ